MEGDYAWPKKIMHEMFKFNLKNTSTNNLVHLDNEDNVWHS
jgi:hypothetical protein